MFNFTNKKASNKRCSPSQGARTLRRNGYVYTQALNTWHNPVTGHGWIYDTDLKVWHGMDHMTVRTFESEKDRAAALPHMLEIVNLKKEGFFV